MSGSQGCAFWMLHNLGQPFEEGQVRDSGNQCMKCSSQGIGLRSSQLRARVQVILFNAAFAFLSASAIAQDPGPSAPDPMGTTFTITEAVIAGGGISYSQSPCFELAGTTAQPVAGPVSGDTFDLYAGFWDRGSSTDTIFRNGFEACQP